MDKLSKDELFLIGIQLDLPDLLKLCKIYKRFDNLVCKKNDIWFHKLREFPNWRDFNMNKIPREIYETIYRLKLFKDTLTVLFHYKFKSFSLLELYNVRSIDLSHSISYSIPEEIYVFENLETLKLNDNQIEEIPKDILKCKKLKTLDLSFNKLEEIPKYIENLENLTVLYLDHNQLVEIPKEIGNLKNLKILDLSFNELIEVPEELSNLNKLEKLNLNNNDLEEIPDKVKNLDFISVKNNPFLEL